MKKMLYYMDSNKINKITTTLNIQTKYKDCDEMCCICMDYGCNDMIQTNCNHHFCIKSLITWFSKDNSNLQCPYCRTQIAWKKCIIFKY